LRATDRKMPHSATNGWALGAWDPNLVHVASREKLKMATAPLERPAARLTRGSS
jgi:hypothetical protein